MSSESIESIEIIKGAAARALYDNPRAANGVILITTKPGGR
jgi:TonB-dependent SusC/RagA subfamily outer membrane receptor